MKAKNTHDLPHVERVTLQPLWGMQPGLYMSLFYLLIILLLLFLIGFLPGLVKSGKRVTFISETTPASVYVDGFYAGVAPLTLFLPPGEHEATFHSYGISGQAVSFSVGRPLFFTWLFPRRQVVNQISLLTDEKTLTTYLRATFDQVVLWSKTQSDQSYHKPPLFTDVASSVYHLSELYPQVVLDFFASSIAYLVDKNEVQQAQDAFESLNLESQTVELKLKEAFAVFSEQQELSPLSDISPNLTFGTDWLPLPNGQSLLGFAYEGGPFILGEPTSSTWAELIRSQVAVEVPPFSIAATYVSEYQWALFVEANPYWSKANIETLKEQNLVDEHYLAGVYPTTAVQNNRPIRNISYYAALAYVHWLEEYVGKRVFIPTEEQWEYAASSVKHKPYIRTNAPQVDENGPSSMLGGYWEFTDERFVPLGRTVGSGPWHSDHNDIIVKGGSFLNDSQDIRIATVGILDPTECSETTSLRIGWSH